ncbi:MAG: YdeI/OmpD-associated family protein [Bacillota bacterium]
MGDNEKPDNFFAGKQAILPASGNILNLREESDQPLLPTDYVNKEFSPGKEVNNLKDTHVNAGTDLIEDFLSLVEDPKSLPTNHLIAVFSLYTLANILNLVQSETAPQMAVAKPQSQQVDKPDKEALMDTLGSLLKSQGMNIGDLVGMLGNKGGANDQNPGDLLAALGKNPAALMNFMNLLTSAKEAINAGKKEERPAKKVDEAKTIPFKERST